MKRNLFLSLLLVFSATSYSQIVNSFGIKSGIAITNQNWDYNIVNLSTENQYRTGLYLGITAEAFRSDYLSLQLDLGYIQKGMQFEVTSTTEQNPDGGPIISVDNRYDFICFQPTAKLRLPTEKFQPYILVGPRIDFYLGYYGDEYLSYFEVSDLSSTTFGLSYGLGVDYNLDDFIISLEGQHQPDLTHFYEGFWLDAKNNAFAFLLSVKYNLDK